MLPYMVDMNHVDEVLLDGDEDHVFDGQSGMFKIILDSEVWSLPNIRDRRDGTLRVGGPECEEASHAEMIFCVMVKNALDRAGLIAEEGGRRKEDEAKSHDSPLVDPCDDIAAHMAEMFDEAVHEIAGTMAGGVDFGPIVSNQKEFWAKQWENGRKRKGRIE